MTNINCNANCVYQKDGKCFLDIATADVLTPFDNCAYFTSTKNSNNL